MKNISSIFLCFYLFIFFIPETKASHMVGSDMEFRCLGNDSFRIILRIYRDCNGIQLNPTPSIWLTTMGCSPSKTASSTMTRVSIKPVDYMCNGAKNVCDSGAFPFGVEEHRFEDTVHLSQIFTGGLDPNCCWIKVSYQECCRNTSITNLSPGNYFIEGEINRCATPCNNSPQITNTPIAVVCNGQPFWFNNGVIDTLDHDSISYELTDPLNPSGPESWQGSFNKVRPLQFLGFPDNTLPFPSGFHLISTTGDIGFTSTAVQQPVLAIKMTEWRKINGIYYKIGVTRRDAQFFTYQCPPNNPPVLKINGSTATPFVASVCPGSTLCLNIEATDVDSLPPLGPDTTKLSWNKAIKGATFSSMNTPVKTRRTDQATFCWTPGQEFASSLPYRFIVKAEDNTCPIPGTSTQSVTIFVRPLPSAIFSNDSIADCGDSILISANAGFQTYSWTTGDTSTSKYVHSNGWYKINVTYSTGCTATDSIYVTFLKQSAHGFTVNDSLQCLNDNRFSFSPIHAHVKSSKWYFGDGDSSLTNTTQYSYKQAGDYTVKVVFVDSNNCLLDTLFKPISVYPQPEVIAQVNDSAQCLNGNNFVFTNNSTINWGSNTYHWLFGDGSDDTLTNVSKSYATIGTYPITLIATSDKGCIDSTFLWVKVLPSPQPNIFMSGSNFASTVSSGNQWFEVNSGAIPGATNSSYTASSPGRYFVLVTSPDSCTGVSDTLDFPATTVKLISSAPFFKIYPNPNDGYFTVEFNQLSSPEIDIQMYDVFGRLVSFERENYTADAIRIKAPHLPDGIYVLQAVSSGKLQRMFIQLIR